VAEHAPPDRRGYFTSFVNLTSSLALLLALLVIIATQIATNAAFGPVAGPDGSSLSPFKAWGWRIPFLLSAVLLAISLWIRLQMRESPVFQAMKAEGARSKSPLKEAFGEWRNIRLGLLALFGLLAGQAVVWYTAHFYALVYLQSILKVDEFTAGVLMSWALLLGIPWVVVFARRSRHRAHRDRPRGRPRQPVADLRHLERPQALDHCDPDAADCLRRHGLWSHGRGVG
jgi:MFS family permease